MMTGWGRWLLILFTLSLAGCKQEYEEISDRPEFEGIVGSQYTTLQGLAINELTSDNDYQGPVDYYVVTKQRMSGPEVLRTYRLDAGVKIEVLKVLQCSNCPFGSPIIVSLDIRGEKLKPDMPVYLYRLRSEKSDGNIVLDPRYFRSENN
ncbi:hypothetical protein [Saccharospirillum salsuginis]|uniref:Lipoprotein n=1 Tax=Saccharospirillum salsuginis TaxID=418750 RepID=A0A918N9X7_9GAMM|nr:hypothetical protein [Saccharospirillum salsuginis]GGX52216.1 hypothetical protein GCM10007392_19430 [Saccharospirillum salsuginis]